VEAIRENSLRHGEVDTVEAINGTLRRLGYRLERVN